MDLIIYILILAALMFVFGFFLYLEAEVGIVISAVAAFVFLFMGFFIPWGKDMIIYHPATSTKVGDELVIQGNFPTMTNGEMKFIDKPVKVRQTIERTVWGYSTTPIRYAIVLDDTKQAESPEIKQ